MTAPTVTDEEIAAYAPGPWSAKHLRGEPLPIGIIEFIRAQADAATGS